MIKYDPRWNKRDALKGIRLKSANGTIIERIFIDQAGFDRAQAFLVKQKQLWEESDQFVGWALEIVVK